MYDMYPWHDRPDAGPAGAGPAKARAAETGATAAATTGATAATTAATTGATAEAMQAVQVALDRRDNGGDAVGAVSPTTPGPTRQ